MICSLLLFGILAAPASPPVTTGSGAKDLDALMRRFAANGWSGSVLVSKGGKEVLAGGYGFADFESERANDADTLFEIASITKSFTAVAVVKLAQQGKLTLDDSIALRLPNVPDHSRAITVRQLLSHTSGIPRNQTAGRGEDLAAAVAAYLVQGPTSKPGSKYEYWNGGYALLAGVIEQASGTSYAQYLEKGLFAPAKMSDSGFSGDTDLDALRDARGAGRNGSDRRALEHPYGSYGYQYRGMGGLVTTVRDLFAWDRALTKNAILDAEHTRELFEPAKDGYALGWRVGTALNGSPRQSHGGSVRGFVSEFRRYPKENACIAVLCNDDVLNPGEVAQDLEAVLFGKSFTTPPPDSTVLTQAQLDACVGVYALPGARMVVRSSPGALVAGFEGPDIVESIGASTPLDWKPDGDVLGKRAMDVVTGLIRKDAKPLRECMAAGIPASWPDDMVATTWPAYIARHGEPTSVSVLSKGGLGTSYCVLVAIHHMPDSSYVRLSFGAEGLHHLDLDARRFLLKSALRPDSTAKFRMQIGKETLKLEFEPHKKGALAVTVAGRRFVRE